MVREIRREVSTNEDTQRLLDIYRDQVATDGGEDRTVSCIGNIATECITSGLEGLDALAQEDETFSYAVGGGIGTQLRTLIDADWRAVMDHYGARQTEDIDIFTTDALHGKRLARKTGYGQETPRPDLDFVTQSTVPGIEEVIAAAERVEFEPLHDSYKFALRVPTASDLLYTKVWDPENEGRRGTYFDAQKLMDRSTYDLDTDRVESLIEEYSPQPGRALDFFERVKSQAVYS